MEQIEKLFKIKQIDNTFLLRIVIRHLNECPTFGRTLKDELKEVLN